MPAGLRYQRLGCHSSNLVPASVVYILAGCVPRKNSKSARCRPWHHAGLVADEQGSRVGPRRPHQTCQTRLPCREVCCEYSNARSTALGKGRKTLCAIVEEYAAAVTICSSYLSGRARERSRMPLFRVSRTADGKKRLTVYVLDDAV